MGDNNPVITKSAMQDLQLGKNGSYSNEGNVLQHTLYDTLTFAATTVRAQSLFFSVPIGTTKTLTETNLQDSGKLPNGQTFLIKSISFAAMIADIGTDDGINSNISAYVNIIQNSVFEIKIAGREFDMQKPGSEFLPSFMAASISAAANVAAAQSMFISTGEIKLAATPIPIGQLVTFGVVQKTGSATSALQTILNTASNNLNAQNAQLQIRLKGILTRAI